MENIELINKYIEILLSSDIHCFILKGPPGIGKTTAVLNKLGDVGLIEDTNFYYINGHITPLKLYEFLSSTRILEDPKVVLLDDVDSIIKNKTSMGILKGALSEARGKRIVSYESSSTKVESRSFEFTGKVIIIVNSIYRNEALESLLDRGIFYDMEVSPKELAEYINKNIETFGGELLTTDEKTTVWDKVKRFVETPGFSLRTLNRAFMFYHHDKDLWYSMFTKTIKKKK